MNTGEALKILVDAGMLTKEEAKELERKAQTNARAEKIRKVREVAVRAFTDYLSALMGHDGVSDEDRAFVTSMFEDLEKELEAEKKKKDEEDPILKFLKSIGAA